MVSNISKAVYHDHIKGSKENGQNIQVVSFLFANREPMSIRSIHKKMNGKIELVSLRRCINNLAAKGDVEMVRVDKCPITGINVGFYRLDLKHTQLNLFR